MPEWRTAEQVEADEKLHTAIEAVLRAYSEDPENHAKWFLTEYIVITARSGIADDNAEHTTYDYSLARGSIPWHNMMGLMRWAQMSMEDKMHGSQTDDES